MPHGTPAASSSPILGSELCTTVPGHMMCIRRDHHSAHFADPRVTLDCGCTASVSVVMDDCNGRFLLQMLEGLLLSLMVRMYIG